MKARLGLWALSVAAVGVVTIAGCASGSSGARPGTVSVVASTNVWGDIAHDVGGRYVSVTSIIANPDQDPHSYQANAHDELAVSQAAVVVENGGGYDDFMQTMRSASGSKATVLDAVAISGKKPVNGDLNEHVWYDFPTVVAVAHRVADALSAKQPAHRSDFQANADRFATEVRALEHREQLIASRDRGDGVAITEPVPLYLLAACGLDNRTPQAFSKAVEDGDGVSAAVLAQTTQLFVQHRVDALVYNEQTTGRETTAVLNAAHAAHIPVVPVTETLPAHRTYLTWMAANLRAVAAALAS